ncbi:MAG: LicD family protein [Dehalococcoidia bacterium]
MYPGNGADEESLEFSFNYNPPMDPAAGERALKEAKEVLDQAGVAFQLSSGTCLGAIRDNAFIPWDDDIDLISVIGSNGLTTEMVDNAVAAFKERGYFVYDAGDSDRDVRAYSMMKDYVRTGWESYRIVDDAVSVYPRTKIPARFFTEPKEITFLGERFLVPNPPEEYLRLKYGEEWMIPKGPGLYEKDVVEKIPSADLNGRPSTLRVLDLEGRPVPGAEVVLAGGGRSRTDDKGYAEVVLPGADWYALTITYPGHEQVLYMEKMAPDNVYVYRADRVATATSRAGGPTGTLGNLLSLE